MGMFDEQEIRGPKEYPLPGQYDARLVTVVDIGTSVDTFEGKEILKHGVFISFELIGTQDSSGKPFLVGKEYRLTNSKNYVDSRGNPTVRIYEKSNLFKLLKKWLKPEDEKAITRVSILGALLKKNAAIKLLIEVELRPDGKKRVSIEGVKPGDESIAAPASKTLGYEIGAPGLDSLPQFLQKKIKACYELNDGFANIGKTSKQAEPAELGSEDDDSIPF